MKKGGKVLKRIAVILLALFSFVLIFVGVAELGAYSADVSWRHFRPDYEKKNISQLLTKADRTESDYEELYRQTGLTKIAIDDCIAKGRADYILEIQDAFFETPQVYKTCFAPFTYIETLDRTIPIAPLQDGDILLSASMRCSFFRYGHSALVVDGEYAQILELADFSKNSEINSATVFSNLASFMVLRPKVSAEIKSQVVASAKQDLLGIKYSLTAGIFGDKYQERPSVSQCAHLVWTAYKRYGIDLDGDGGAVVKPKDFLSSSVEVVQVYGFDLEELWR